MNEMLLSNVLLITIYRKTLAKVKFLNVNVCRIAVK